MSRNVQLILLCEDSQHEAFARRFLMKAGWSQRQVRVIKAPPGKGAAEQFVRERYPVELAANRSQRHRVARGLVVVIDGDRSGVVGRITELDQACRKREIKPRAGDEPVAIFVPTWNIQTWLAYLDGRTVDENRDDYPRLPRERDCQRHVRILYDMCQEAVLRQPSPPSLDAACEEYQTRLRSRSH